MRDFPFFTTEYGVASLVLREVPYREEAYIHIQEAQPEHLTEHIQQCRDFCRAVGAEHIYIKEYPGLPQLPLHTQMVQMSGTAWVDLEKLCALFPVTEATVGRWRAYHNRRMAGVDNAATLEAREEGKILPKRLWAGGVLTTTGEWQAWTMQQPWKPGRKGRF